MAPHAQRWYIGVMTTYRTAKAHEGSDWVVIATRADDSQESLTRHSTEAEAGTMADRLSAFTLARVIPSHTDG
jgi:hypothetical protein